MHAYITNGTLIDGTGRAPVALQWLEIEDGVITRVCTEEEPRQALAPDAHVLHDAAHMTVMPGLVDAHCHISYGGAHGIEEQELFASAEYRAIRGVWHAGQVLQAGVTSFSDPGGSWFVGVAVRDAIAAGMFRGPRITAAARYLTTRTGLADYFPSWVGSPPSGVGALTRNTSEMLDEIRLQVKNGVDFIKIAASGESPILTPGGGSVPAFRAEELKIIVDEVHRLGRRVAAHARSGQAVADCIEAGIDWIMHGDFMSREQAQRLAESGIPCCPALTLLANIVDWGHLAGCSTARIDRIRKRLDEGSEILSYAYRQGVKMMCGTDTGFAVTPYGEWHARELELFVKLLGMSPLEAITCGTKNAALALEPQKVGTIEPGKLADVLVIDGDPLRDIRILQDKNKIREIFLGGAPVKQAPAGPVKRWPWEQSLTISRGEITQELVRAHA